MAVKTKRRKQTRSTPIATKRSAELLRSPKTLDPDKRTVRATIATDSPVLIYDWEEDEQVEEVLVPSGMIEPKRMRLRVDHSSWRSLDVIGSVFDFNVSKSRIDATLRFSRAADVQPIFDRVVEGDLDAVSIAASYLMRNTKRIEPGESYTHEGITYRANKLPVRLVLRWQPSETSVVDEGADPKAVIRRKQSKNGTPAGASVNSPKRSRRKIISDEPGTKNMATTRKTKRNQRPVKTERRVRTPDQKETLKRRTPDATDRAPVKTERVKPQPADEPPAKPNEGDSRDLIQATERKRVARILEMASGPNDIPQKLVQKAIKEGWSVARTGKAFFAHLQKSSDDVVSQSGDGINRAPAAHIVGDATVEALQAAVLMRSGISLEHKAFASDAAQIAFSRNGVGLEWLHRMNSELSDKGKSDAEKIIDIGRKFRNDSPARTCERILSLSSRRAVPHDVEEIVERSFSSAYMPRVFGALVHTGIILGYAEYQDSTIGWVSTADWADFRMNQPIGIDGTRGLRKHTRGTAAKDVDFTDYGEPYALARYTGKFTLDDMDIIDDQIGANQLMPQEIGKMAARLRPDLIYALLLSNANLSDGTPLFHTSRGNIVASAPVSIDGLTKAEATMALQKVVTKTGTSVALNMTAGHVIVGRSYRAEAKKATASTKVVSGSVVQIGDMNPHEGEYMVHSDARIDIGVEDPRSEIAVTGTTDHWFLAESNGNQTLQVGYRRGTGRAPMIRTKQITDIGVWGIGWDCAHDIGVGVMAARGLVRAKITA